MSYADLEFIRRIRWVSCMRDARYFSLQGSGLGHTISSEVEAFVDIGKKIRTTLLTDDQALEHRLEVARSGGR